ncbi:hypothetical protein MRX96_013239 [Rhipicephalus microplus]
MYTILVHHRPSPSSRTVGTCTLLAGIQSTNSTAVPTGKSAYWRQQNPVHVCNRGSKLYSSIKSCLASCVNGCHVSDRCWGSTLFFPHTRQDVLDVPWYFHGKKCVAWSFPQESECDETPAAETGSPRQLRLPYFADMQPHGGAHCVNVTRRALKSHRILIGSNQFDSLDGCGRACVRS